MIDKFKGFKKIAPIFISLIAFLLFRFCNISPILGSRFSFFSLSGALMPMLGVFGIPATLLGLLLRFGIPAFSMEFFTFLKVYHIPTLCASYYWSSQARLFSIGVPLLCMMAFLIHPVGVLAAPYTFYWLIPIALGIFNKKSLYATALISTFIAHAVGSVVWLYTVPMTSADWISLIPVVAVERSCFAGLMILVYYAGSIVPALFASLKIQYTKIKGFVG